MKKRAVFILFEVLALLCLAGCTKINKAMNKPKTYEWSTTANAPKGYPATLWGSMDYEGGSAGIRGGGVLKNGWGRHGSSYVSSNPYKPVPSALSVFYLSYAEDQFYRGHFKLDQEKIRKLLEEGKVSKNNGKREYDSDFVTCVAPGGTVGLWLNQGNFSTEVGFFKAEKTDANWKDVYPHAVSRERFVRPRLERYTTPEQLAIIDSGIPFNSWEDYRNKYTWSLEVKDAELDYVVASFFNGESEPFYVIGKRFDFKIIADTNIPRALPKNIYMSWKEPDERVYIVDFTIPANQYYRMSEFLEAHNNQGVFQLVPHRPKGITQLKLCLRSGSDQVEIKLEPYQVFQSRRNLDLDKNS